MAARPPRLSKPRILALSVALAALCCSPPEKSGAPRPPLALGPPVAGAVSRIASLAPSLTEIVLALDPALARAIAGVTRFDDAPEVAGAARVGGYVDPSVEAVLALKPDLVLAEAAPGNRAAIERLAALGIPVRAFFLGTRAEILAAIEEVARLVGRGDEGRALRAAIERRLTAIEGAPRPGPSPRAIVIYGWEPIVAAGPGTFADELLRSAGGRNALAEARAAYPALTAEALLAASPALIVDAAHARPPIRAEILGVLAARGGRLAEASPALLRPGVRLAEAVEELYRALWPARAPAAAEAPADSPRQGSGEVRHVQR